MNLRLDQHPTAVRAAAVVACSTLVLTASFMGLLAAVRGAIVDPGRACRCTSS